MKRIDSLAEKNKKLEAALARHENVKAAIMAANEGLTLFNTVPIGISITNAKGATIKANNTVLELLGYTQEETEKLDLFNVYVDAEERSLLIDKLKKTGSVRDFETDLSGKTDRLSMC
jgi:PAS domain-containing protein